MIWFPRMNTMRRILCVLTLLAAIAWAQDAQPLTVYANGKPIQVTPVIRDGTTYYPVDGIVHALGGRIYWDPAKKIYKINDNDVGIAPVYLGGHFYLPIEAIAQATKAAVTWDLARNQVTMKSQADQPPTSVANVSTPRQPMQVEDPKSGGPTWDATMDGRLPVGWQFPNPHSNEAPPMPSPGVANTTRGQLKTAKQIASGSHDVFVPRSTQNAAFQLTITNFEVVGSFKGYYQPRGGHVFAIVYLSQKNVSGAAQVYPGKLHLADSDGHTYDAMDELSNFWPVIMRPYGINFGYLVYEIPDSVAPSQVVLTTVGNPPLSVNL